MTTSVALIDRPAATTSRRERHPGANQALVSRLVTHLCLIVGVLLSVFPF